MNKFQKLAQLNRDIELLENAGKIKSAEVLHKKFLKEAQLGFGPAFPQLGIRQPQMGNMQLATTPVSNIGPNPDPRDDVPTSPQGTPYVDDEAAVTNSQFALHGLGTAMSQPQATSGDTANQMQAQNTMPAESPIYQQAINQIAKLLQTKNPMNRTTAQSIYENTINQFKDPKRKQAFANQFQRLMSTNFPGQSLKPGA